MLSFADIVMPNGQCRTSVVDKFFFFLNTYLGYPLNFIFAFHCQVKGAYLCLAEVKWVKTGVPRLFICLINILAMNFLHSYLK